MRTTILTEISEKPRMNRHAQGLLAIWHGIEDGFAPVFDDWYDRQHHLERVNIAGFLRARRYVNTDAGQRYFARYDVTDPSVLASAPYLWAVNNPTDWTQSLMPRYRNTSRAVFRYAQGAGLADGGDLVTLRFNGSESDATVRIGSEEMTALVGAAGVLRIEVWHSDAAVSTLGTKEKKLRREADAGVAQAILVEGSNIDRITDAVAKFLLPLLPAPAAIDRYRLVFQAHEHGRTKPLTR